MSATPAMELPVTAVVVAAVLIVPALAALVLRRARAPGAAAIGGALAGLLLGPGVLGRMIPEPYERMFIGGVQEREAVDKIARQRGGYLVAADAAHIDAEGRRTELERFDDQHREARAAWEAAAWEYQEPLRIFTLLLVAGALIGSGLQPRPLPPLAGARAMRTSLVHAASIGLSSAAFPGVLAYLAARTWGCSAPVAALTSAAVAIGPWTLTAIDRQAADDAELGGARLMENAGRMASFAAIAVAAAVMWSLHRWTGLLFVSPLGALIVSWLISPRTAVQTREVTGMRWAGAAVDHVLLPALAAVVAIRIEPFHHASLWPLVVLVLLSGDGRWLGALFGALLPGGRGGVRTFRTMRLVLGSMAAGPTQLAVAAIALHTRTLPESIGFGLLLGAIVIEATAPLRRGMAQRLIATEEAIDEE